MVITITLMLRLPVTGLATTTKITNSNAQRPPTPIRPRRQPRILFKVGANLVEGEHAIAVGVGELERILDVDELVPLAQLAHHVVVAALEVVGDLELVALVGDLRLDLRVRVVDDGQEHVLRRRRRGLGAAISTDITVIIITILLLLLLSS